MTEAPAGAQAKAGHFLELDGMRGVLASTVMLFHFGLSTLIAKATGGRVHDGVWPMCVDFFFLLSGFVLCQSFIRRPTGLPRYAVKRLLRLAPMFLLTTAVVLAISWPGSWSGATIAANFLMVQSLLGLASINMVSWSIPFELVLPALGVIAIGPAVKLKWPVIAVLLILALAAQCWGTWLLAKGEDLQYLRAGAGLAAGALLFLLRRSGPSPTFHPTLVALAFFAGACLVMMFGGMAKPLGLAFPLLATGAIWFGAQARGLFSTAPFQALGRWSYSIYLLHIPVILAANRLLGETVVDGNPAAKLALIVITLALAGLCYRLIELPFMTMGGTGAAQAKPTPTAF